MTHYTIAVVSPGRVEVWAADDAGPIGDAPVKVARSRFAARLWIVGQYFAQLFTSKQAS